METEKMLYQVDTATNTIFDRIRKYLAKKYQLRFNEIALEFEIKTENGDWTELNLNSLYIELTQAGINIAFNKLEILMRSHLITVFNPFQNYFQNLEKWDGENHIQRLTSFVKTTDAEPFQIHFEKWLTRSVLCALKKGYINKQCFVFYNTKQNSGKTSFLRFLIPPSLEKYYTEDIGVDKDGLIALCKNFIINIDELSVMSKTDVNILKAFISKNTVNARLPYDRKSSLMYRTSSFCGSTNRSDFLTDETGSVRWIIFEVLEIDFGYSKKININQVWAQAYHNAFERKNYNPELTAEDLVENEKRNEKFKQITLEQEILISHFEKSENKNDFLTATEIMLAMSNALGVRMNNVKIGKALTALNFERIKHSKKQVYGYLIKRKIEDEKNE
ncbi:virulence-associated E family protein [Elizabethkingia anophelis]|jgi:predicted P-loop ATPase|uniref:Virulence-associated E family protein n=2 Tax=Weeksellaceae TaxID=2762318 RepID=A0A3G8Y3L4_9FLAO|nr:virulence-associated E family protein [Epilithonimonas vandammei]MCT3651980.1 virulence-associated E family protein [Elizabethkingia anophelis]QUY53841.1 virulence-associated E family protein [Chryseobacterium arthrosphaerae]MCT3659266.1 virulence-associated E family protein [Elizabethkingia anophelis]MCT3666431.1 virulence-associated E family protein [Elizabethkingia anophelis]